MILSHDRKTLINQRATIQDYLQRELKLDLHSDKIILKTFASGVDFLGWVNFPRHRVLRTATKRRMINKLNEKNLQSYLGLIRHGNTYKLANAVLNLGWRKKF